MHGGDLRDESKLETSAGTPLRTNVFMGPLVTADCATVRYRDLFSLKIF